MQTVLGINAYHGDSAACLVEDGRVVAAVEEERFNRVKHWAGFPRESIRWCLASRGLKLGDLDAVAVNRDPRSNLRRKVGYVLRRRPSVGFLVDRARNTRAWSATEELLEEALPGQGSPGRVEAVEHHLAHLASAFHCSGYEEAVAVSVDGFGDFASAAWGLGTAAGIPIDDRVYFPHSLGAFYQAITQFLGFPNYGDEYKVMGLAPYGEPAYAAELREVARPSGEAGFALDMRFFRFHEEDHGYEWRDTAPASDAIYSQALCELLGAPRGPDEAIEQRHRDLARSAQAVYEELFFRLLAAVHRRYGVDRLAVAGGCGANSVANGKIHLETPFRDVYLPPSPGDAGGAIGAALVLAHRADGGLSDAELRTAALGPAYTAAEIDEAVERRRHDVERAGCDVVRIDDEAALCRRAAQTVAEGRVLGWFQGAMEFGPRALGNRSIVGDPRRADMKDILNAKIKRRESFRPFAPSVLRGAVPEWFDSDADVPFMSRVFVVRLERREQIPAVTHVDGTGRLQTVEPADNPRYATLIEAFRELSGVPMVLNTSFNENEPIVCRPEEALDCFLRTDMDVLVMGDLLLERRGDGARPTSARPS